MATRAEEVSQILREKYKDDKSNCAFINCISQTISSWDYEFFFKAKNKKTGKNKFTIGDIKEINSKLPAFASDIRLDGRHLVSTEKTGMFKVTFSDESFMYFAKWFTGIGKNRGIESMFASENETWIKFLKMSKDIRSKQSKPKLGVYNVETDQFGITHYIPFKKIPNNTIFHNELDKIRDSINYYFAHVEDYMRFNQPGRRTILLYGKPGTSKTSTLYKLALEHKATKSVVFATNIQALYQHVSVCEKYNVPTIACFEDCESAMGRNNSDVKNFLSGILARQNKGGTCIVYTTNYPDRIEESIRERPERIDELHHIGPITGELLVECAKYYFGEFAPSENILRGVFVKEMTGAEVKLTVENILRYCASAQQEINAITMRKVLSNYRDDVEELNKFIKGKTGKTLVNSINEDEPMGFTSRVSLNSRES